MNTRAAAHAMESSVGGQSTVFTLGWPSRNKIDTWCLFKLVRVVTLNSMQFAVVTLNSMQYAVGQDREPWEERGRRRRLRARQI